MQQFPLTCWYNSTRMCIPISKKADIFKPPLHKKQYSVRFEVFTAVTMKNVVFWDVTPCRACVNRSFGGRYRLHFQGRKIRERETYKILSNILLSRLSPCIDKIIGDLQCGFRRNRSTTDQIFYIRQILEKKWEYNETVHQLFVDIKKAL
jgi:hypothetical protein